MTFIPRPHQQKVLEYRGGYMGVSAVPGSGKTATLSALAARLVGELTDEDQEVLVVTFANSSVDTFKARIGGLIKDQGLLPGIGYRVRTMHSLALDIIRERPDLVHLSNEFGVVDDRAATSLREGAAAAWLAGHPDSYMQYLNPDIRGGQLNRVINQDWRDLVKEIAANFISRAKDRRYTPERLRRQLEKSAADLPLARMGVAIYQDYEAGLARQAKVDFADMVRLALDAVGADAEYLANLRKRWPYILEDEAQDSTELQENLLRALVGEGGNWVRMGDPNQAIYETFTNANPRFLVNFLNTPEVERRELPTSGRSAPGIIALANYLVDWSAAVHPLPSARQALLLPHILPTEAGDRQPNPPDDARAVYFRAQGYRADNEEEEEAAKIADNIASWLPTHQDRTVAILVPRNKRGAKMADALRSRGIKHIEMLQSTGGTRGAADALHKVLGALDIPDSGRRLADAYAAWRASETASDEGRALVDRCAQLLRTCQRVEDYLWPTLERDWLAGLRLGDEPADAQARQELIEFRETARRWQRAVTLPADQLVLTLAQDLFSEATDLALAHKIAVLLAQRSSQPENVEWGLRQLMEELKKIVSSERRFLGVAGEDTGFNPDDHKGVVVVATIHRAKGLEWDRVYLPSASAYDFPAGEEGDSYIAEKFFVRDHLNLGEEALAQLDALMLPDVEYVEGAASRLARERYVAERLRLLYVGITRARRELVVTWNTGHQKDQGPALAFKALSEYWEAREG